MNKRFTATLIVGLVLLFTLSACSVVNDITAVGDAGKAFMAAMENQDSATAWDMMTPELQTDIGTFESWDEYVQSFKFTDAKFSSTNIENGTGYLEGTANVETDVYNVSLVLDQVNDNWALSGINFELQ